jgi:hypothetical protein
MRIPPSPVLALALGLTAAACAESPELGAQTAAATVGDYVTTACSTAVVLELSRQIAAEVDCLDPGQLVAFPRATASPSPAARSCPTSARPRAPTCSTRWPRAVA